VARLVRLNKELDSMGFSTAHWDEDYREYFRCGKRIFPEIAERGVNDSPEAQRNFAIRQRKIVRKLLEIKSPRKRG